MSEYPKQGGARPCQKENGHPVRIKSTDWVTQSANGKLKDTDIELPSIVK